MSFYTPYFAMLNRWVIDYSPLIAAEAKKCKHTIAMSWRLNETYVNVKGHWVYFYTARLINWAIPLT